MKKITVLFVLISMFCMSSCLVIEKKGDNGKKKGWYKNGKAYGEHPSQNGKGKSKN